MLKRIRQHCAGHLGLISKLSRLLVNRAQDLVVDARIYP